MKKCICTFTRFQTIIEPPKAESQEENILILKIIGRGIVPTIDRALLTHIALLFMLGTAKRNRYATLGE